MQPALVNGTKQHGDSNIQSILLGLKDHSKLLDVIDRLRYWGTHHYVSVPQIIVCGNQSSGKSSVLNAISSFELPTKDGLCTRFAIELVLRNAKDVNISLTITPGGDRSAADKVRFASFQYPNANLGDLPDIVAKARETMGIVPDGRSVTDDVLRIEYSGPDQPNLTLVDLPGVIHSESKHQTSEEVDIVTKLVESYMRSRRSVILAVVSAKDDYANQIITKMAHKADPKGQRTLGLITKPDTLHEGSESERLFIELAQNEQISFKLGWHVLKNREWNEKHFTNEERNESERSFFSKGVWTNLPSDCLGVESLRTRLAVVLQEQIVSELPALIQDIERGIQECEVRLSRLGGARATRKEQTAYLINLSQAFTTLIKAASDGVYYDSFFGDARTRLGFSKRLRAVVVDCLKSFSDDIHRDGHAKIIVETGKVQQDDPRQISREEYLKGVDELLRRSRGRELPGLFNPMIVSDLFYEQSKPWAQIVDTYQAKLLDTVSLCVDLVIDHIADRSTCDGLNRYVIGPAKELYAQRLQTKINEIMKPHVSGHPITYNQDFVTNFLKTQQERMRRTMDKKLRSALSTGSNASADEIYKVSLRSILDAMMLQYSDDDVTLRACSDATDAMQAYYKVALKELVDNFSTLATEFCVIEELEAMFKPNTVVLLSDTEVAEIAAETKESQAERASATAKLTSLQKGLRELKSLNRFSINTLYSDEEEKMDDDDQIATPRTPGKEVFGTFETSETVKSSADEAEPEENLKAKEHNENDADWKFDMPDSPKLRRLSRKASQGESSVSLLREKMERKSTQAQSGNPLSTNTDGRAQENPTRFPIK